MSNLPITEAELHAWVDATLPEARRAEVQAYLATRPEEAERARAYLAQKQKLRALFNPVLDEAVPESLVALTSSPLPSTQRNAARSNGEVAKAAAA